MKIMPGGIEVDWITVIRIPEGLNDTSIRGAFSSFRFPPLNFLVQGGPNAQQIKIGGESFWCIDRIFTRPGCKLSEDEDKLLKCLMIKEDGDVIWEDDIEFDNTEVSVENILLLGNIPHRLDRKRFDIFISGKTYSMVKYVNIIGTTEGEYPEIDKLPEENGDFTIKMIDFKANLS